MKAYGYVRLSRDRDDTTSPQRQRKAIADLCKARKWDLVETFEDVDVSAFTGKERPAFEGMMGRLDEVDALVFWKLDRLTRSTVESGRIAQACKDAGVKMVSTDGDVDTDSAAGMFTYDILIAAAKFESARIAERSKSMHQYKREMGQPVGRVPYGWRRVGKHDEPYEPEQRVIRDAAQRFVGGESIRSIARSHDMYPNILNHVLRSARVHAVLPPELATALDTAIAGLGEPHRFERVKTTMLGGIAKCGVCGGSLSVTSTRAGRDGPRWYSLRCQHAGHVSIAGPWLENHVSEAVLAYIDVDKLMAARRRKAMKTRKVSEIEAKIDALDARYTNGTISEDRFERMNASLLEQLNKAKTAERANGVDLPGNLARNLSERWPEMPVDLKRRVIAAVCESITVSKATGHGPITPDRVAIRWA